MPDLNPFYDERNIQIARDFLKSRGFVVIREKSYRQAQERQHIADVRCQDAKEFAASQDRWWREEILPELFAYRDRVTFLYGAARAAGCTVEELAGGIDANNQQETRHA